MSIIFEELDKYNSVYILNKINNSIDNFIADIENNIVFFSSGCDLYMECRDFNIGSLVFILSHFAQNRSISLHFYLDLENKELINEIKQFIEGEF